MSIEFSPLLPANRPGAWGGPAQPGQAPRRPPEHVLAAFRREGGPQAGQQQFHVRVLDLHDMPEWASPLIFVFQGRQVGGGFPVHPHAGFSAISIVFEDSETSLRTRDSLGNDFLVDAGGIAWSEAARGIVHDELPAEPDRELNGAQIFVNLSSAHKFAEPKVMHLAGSKVPVWRGDSGDRVRVSVGSFDGVSSPIAPTEPYNLFDIDLRTQISFEAQTGHNTVLYVLDGQMVVRTDGREQQMEGGNGLALHGDSGTVTFQAAQPTHFLLLSGPELLEPVVFDGNFIMNDQSQIEAARARYEAGEMGTLAPLANGSQQETAQWGAGQENAAGWNQNQAGPVEWNQVVIQQFRTNGGNVTMIPTPVLLLTTIGRKSGKSHTTPVGYMLDADRLIVVPSGDKADWYFNLLANPQVTVEVGTQIFAARATLVEGPERDHFLEQARQIAQTAGTGNRPPEAGDMAEHVTTDGPVVALERAR